MRMRPALMLCSRRPVLTPCAAQPTVALSSDSEEDRPASRSKKKGQTGFTDDTFGTDGAKALKKKRVRGTFWKVLDKVCPCCAVSSKYKPGQDKSDAKFKLYEGVDNTLEPILRLLSLFTMGVSRHLHFFSVFRCAPTVQVAASHPLNLWSRSRRCRRRSRRSRVRTCCRWCCLHCSASEVL